jgi:hypothetical protein
MRSTADEIGSPVAARAVCCIGPCGVAADAAHRHDAAAGGGGALCQKWHAERMADSVADVLVGFGIPPIIAAIPVARVKLPNKTYWFAPQRREQTIDFFKTWFAWFGCALLACMIFVDHLV